jgi:hypothetical protein
MLNAPPQERSRDIAAPSPILDHIVIDVREKIDAAAQCFARLGFQLTPRGEHTLGSHNHLAVFATDYLELLGFGAGGVARAELQPFPIGLNGLVFKAADAERIHAHARAAGLPILPVQSLWRPVTLPRTREKGIKGQKRATRAFAPPASIRNRCRWAGFISAST